MKLLAYFKNEAAVDDPSLLARFFILSFAVSKSINTRMLK